jgi:sulfate/thiosulfate-binding protein
MARDEKVWKLRDPDHKLPSARMHAALWMVGFLLILASCWVVWHPFRGEDELLVIAYDASREYFEAVNAAYAAQEPDAGRVRVSHAGSVEQAGNLARGLVADVVCFASEGEMAFVQNGTGCVGPDWKDRLPYGSSPFASTIVVVVEAGNPMAIVDWKDLYRPGVRLCMPHPGTSGAGRYAYLALLADALDRNGGINRLAEEELRTLMMRVQMIDLGAYQALDVFKREKTANAFLTWESDAIRRSASMGQGKYEIVYPPKSILAEPVVALIECHVATRRSRDAANAYLEFLFSPEGQEIALKAGLRPRTHEGGYSVDERFPNMELFPVSDLFGDWATVWERHFGPDGTLAFIMKLRAAQAGGVE